MKTGSPFNEVRYAVLLGLAAVAVHARVVVADAVIAATAPALSYTATEGEPPAPEEPPVDRDNEEGLPPEPTEPPAEPDTPPTESPPSEKSEDRRSADEGRLEGAPPEPDEAAPAKVHPPQSVERPEAAAEPPAPIVLRQYRILRPVDQFRRTPFQPDVVEAALVSGDWQPPQDGDDVEGSTGTRRRWEAVQAPEDGSLRVEDLRGGYAYATYESPGEQIALLHARGHSMVYVNGIPRAGDAYNNGWLRLPIQLREGTNDFLFHVARGELVARLETPRGAALLDHQDATLPDLIVGEPEPKWAAVWVINASEEALEGVKLVCEAPGGTIHATSVFQVPPLSIRKVPFQVEGSADPSAEQVERAVRLVRPDGEEEHVLNELSLALRVVDPTEQQVRTFVSEVDGSVQPYAILPASVEGSQPAGVILSLHGAAVDAASHASYYSSRTWAHVVAPTNRRPYGFDWEDWGRVDALEVLAEVEKRLEVDPRRVFLTGHSMGGHGAWHLGSTYPGRFAVVAPSGGWISFETYTRAGTAVGAPTARILERAANPSQTLALKTNLGAAGIYVLHGSEDEHVPVSEARQMREQLGSFHPDFAYYERPGAGHWWGGETVDWPPMMDYFQHHELPEAKDVERIDFTTMNPGVSARSGWLMIEAQQTQFAPSTAEIECDAEDREFLGTTANIARMALDVSHLEPGASIRVELDNQRLRDVRWPNVTRTIWLEKDGSRWRASDPPSPSLKGPHRYGLFKDAFRNRPVLVYGTRGNDDENRWAFAKARFDAETFLYRGNGTLEVVSDRDFNSTEYEDRNIVLYGNADTNRAWPSLLSTCPVQIRRGSARVGLRSELGDDLACLFIYPRRGSGTASVGIVSGTGLEGMHLTNRLRYFVSGVAYPDLVIFDSSVLREGDSAIRAAGFFGLDWQLETGDIAWRDLAL